MKNSWNKRRFHLRCDRLKRAALAVSLLFGSFVATMAAPEQLATQGNQIVIKSTGAPVRLTGVNIPSLEWGNGEHLIESLNEVTSNWNSNVVRLPVKGSSWLGSGSYRGIVDNFITQASALDVYVILDLHGYGYPTPNDVLFWQDAADHFKNNPAVLFGLLNEPHGISWDEWLNGYNGNPGMQDLVDTVRATGANNVVLAGGREWGYKLTEITNGYALTDTASGNGIVYDSHVYPWKKYFYDHVMKTAQEYPVLLGEFGHPGGTTFIGLTFEHHSTWVPKYLDIADQFRLHWTGWCMHPTANPVLIEDWNYTPSSHWGAPAKERLLLYGDDSATRILGGVIIGTPGTSSDPNSGVVTDWRKGVASAFMPENSLQYYFRAPIASGAWAGVDSIEPHIVQQILFAPRENYGDRMVGGEFQVSSTADFSNDVHTIHTITAAPVADGATVTSVYVSSPGAYRYMRYIGPDDAYCNVALLRFLGVPEAEMEVPPVTTWYLQSNNIFGEKWNQLSMWFSESGSGGSNPLEMSPLATYEANGHLLRSVDQPSGEDFFEGGVIRLVGDSSRMFLKGFSAANTFASRIILEGGRVIAGSGGSQAFDVARIDAVSGNSSLQAFSGRTIDLWVGSLQGSGNLQTIDYGTVALSILDATSYTGLIDHQKGTLQFKALSYGRPFVMAGSLKVSGSATVVLDNDVYLTGLEIGGVVYSDGTYDATTLGFTGVGSITVQGASATWFNADDQAISYHWNQLSEWYSEAGGAGVNAWELSPLDFYETSHVLRTDDISSGEGVFDGGVLKLTGSSGRLFLKVYNSAIAFAPRLVLNGGEILPANYGVQKIDVARIDVEALSSLTASSGRSLDLWAATLQGSGDLQIATSSSVHLSVLEATGYTGTIHHNSGTLVFEALPNGRPFAMSGQLVVAQGASVTLNSDVFVRGLTADGQMVTDGVYAAASLGFSGAGTITVQSSD